MDSENFINEIFPKIKDYLVFLGADLSRMIVMNPLNLPNPLDHLRSSQNKIFIDFVSKKSEWKYQSYYKLTEQERYASYAQNIISLFASRSPPEWATKQFKEQLNDIIASGFIHNYKDIIRKLAIENSRLHRADVIIAPDSFTQPVFFHILTKIS